MAAPIDENKIDEDGTILTEKLDMLIYLTGEYWSLGYNFRGSPGLNHFDHTCFLP